MSIGDFLADQSLGSWADEMDSQPIPSVSASFGSGRDRAGPGGMGGERRAFTGPSTWERSSGGVSGGDMGGRGPSYGMDISHYIILHQNLAMTDSWFLPDRPRFSDREELPLPSKPPYTAHMGNLAFDVSQDDVTNFLTGCEPTNVRIVEDKIDRKPKGFGYVEFATLDGLKQALTMSGMDLMGRAVRLSIAEPPKDRPEPSRDFSNWERRGPLPDLPQSGRQPSFRGNRSFADNGSDAGSDRGGSKRGGYFEAEGKSRDFGNWERKGPLSPVPGNAPGSSREGGRVRDPARASIGERRPSPNWGDARSTDPGAKLPRRDSDRPIVERVPTAAESDNQWRSRMRPDPSPAATPDVSTPSSPAAKEAPKERPRLNLAKRTVSNIHETEPGSAGDAKASPFGAAKPIDTAAREKQVEEKRELAIRQKAEADAKAKEEKAAAAKTPVAEGQEAGTPTSEKPGPRRASRQQNGNAKAGQPNGDKEKADKAEKAKPSFNMLHSTEGGEETGEQDAPDASANGTILGDKEVKPQEVVREVSKDGAASQNAEPTAKALDEEGWSTVPTGGKNKRASRGGNRALAS
ncbi:hypothetical protein K431DRAFT_93582 [Polychaeton citri CBS 116435]|uniref:RRM domain-containing protein n=1 Tax=Polychaeton citri CBS 116435 TaxID=1314669 RepID=A0A9P4Q984_9PEZI|nr:hypothetical protein K431DRAFT_93582 [Polychaeton citri CBS 116435]